MSFVTENLLAKNNHRQGKQTRFETRVLVRLMFDAWAGVRWEHGELFVGDIRFAWDLSVKVLTNDGNNECGTSEVALVLTLDDENNRFCFNYLFKCTFNNDHESVTRIFWFYLARAFLIKRRGSSYCLMLLLLLSGA